MDFSSIGGVPVIPSDKKFDFSSIGGVPVDKQFSLDQFKTNVVKNIIGNQFSDAANTIAQGLTAPGRLLQAGYQAAGISTPPPTLLGGLTNVLPKTNRDLKIMASAELGIPAAGIIAEEVAPVAGQLLAGVKRGATQRIIEMGKQGKSILPALEQVDIQGVLSKAADVLKNSRDRLGSAIGEIVNSFDKKLGGNTLLDASDVAKQATETMASTPMGLRGPADIARSNVFGSPSNTIKFKSIIDEVAANPKLSPSRLYELKRQAQDILDIPAEGMQTALRNMNVEGAGVIKAFTQGIDNLLESVVPGFKAANQKFSNKATVYSTLQKHIFSGDPVQKAKALLQPNSKINQAIRGLNQATQGDFRLIDNIKNSIAASESGSLLSDLPRTGLGAFLLGKASQGGPESLIPLALSTSPRLFGLGTQAGARLAGFYQPGIPATISQGLFNANRR